MRRVRVLGFGDAEPGTSAWTPVGRQDGAFTTPAGLHVEGAPMMKFNPDDLRTLAIKFLKGCYFSVLGSALPPGTPCWGKAFTKDPSPFITRLTKIPGCKVQGEPPFEFAIAVDSSAPATSGAAFVLWGFHILAATSTIPLER